jgi:hypothetical protein
VSIAMKFPIMCWILHAVDRVVVERLPNAIRYIACTHPIDACALSLVFDATSCVGGTLVHHVLLTDWCGLFAQAVGEAEESAESLSSSTTTSIVSLRIALPMTASCLIALLLVVVVDMFAFLFVSTSSQTQRPTAKDSY